MSTFGTMVSDIEDDLNKTNLNAQIKRKIVASMRNYRHRRFKFNYASSTFTTSDGQSVYPLPDGHIGDELVEVLDGSFRGVLEKVAYSQIAKQDNYTNYTGEPRQYAIIDGNNMRLFPVPNNGSNASSGDYGLLMHYHKDLNKPGITGAISVCATTTMTNGWMTDGYDLIMLEAKIRVYTEVIRGQESAAQAQVLIPQRNAALLALIKEYQISVASGQLQSSER